jgi:hypothetical protein
MGDFRGGRGWAQELNCEVLGKAPGRPGAQGLQEGAAIPSGGIEGLSSSAKLVSYARQQRSNTVRRHRGIEGLET